MRSWSRRRSKTKTNKNSHNPKPPSKHKSIRLVPCCSRGTEQPERYETAKQKVKPHFSSRNGPKPPTTAPTSVACAPSCPNPLILTKTDRRDPRKINLGAVAERVPSGDRSSRRRGRHPQQAAHHTKAVAIPGQAPLAERGHTTRPHPVLFPCSGSTKPQESNFKTFRPIRKVHVDLGGGK